MNVCKRPVICLLLAFLGCWGVLWFCGWVLRPKLPTEPVHYPAELLAEAERLREVQLNKSDPPRVWQEVDYSEGPAGSWYPKGQSPILASLEAKGKLPPVSERVGQEPVVLGGPDGIGVYGGTWIRAASSPLDVSVIRWRMSGTSLVRWSPEGYPIVPHLAKGWEASPDRREWTVYFRKGMRWSDGHPFTAHDVVYWWEHDIKALGPSRPRFMRIAGTVGEVKLVDEYTVKFIFEVPHGLFLERLAAAEEVYAPRHYLARYHPEIGDDALINATMAARRIPTRQGLYNALKEWSNPEHPRLWPWVYRTFKSTPPQSFVRNPYYWAVDPAGNQLPYLDRVTFEVRNVRLISNIAAAGGLTMQARHIRYDDYTLLMSGRERNDYEVRHWFSASRSVWVLFPNINRHADPGDRIALQKAELLKNRDFRIALSLAIDRQSIIDAEYNSVGEPAQLSPGRESDFHNEHLHTSYVEYDPAEAARMLDALNLHRRDSSGMRTFPDGSPMVWYIDTTDYSGISPAQFIVDDWARVGIAAVAREQARLLFNVRKLGRQHDFTVWMGESEFNPLVEPRSFVPTNTESHQAVGFGKWYEVGGLYGYPYAEEEGGLPPPPGHPYLRAMHLLDRAMQETDREEQNSVFQKVLDLNADNLFTINIATPPPQLAVVKKGFRNVPDNVIFGHIYRTPVNAGIETFFFDNPADSKGGIEKTREEILTITPPPNAIDLETLVRLDSGNMGPFIRHVLLGILIALVLMIGLRHPFVLRRLFILVPTLLVISIAIFAIIQAPPGDFIQSKIQQAQMTGDQVFVDEVEQIRELFPVNKPFLAQYAVWMGLPWFLTFDRYDTGLLQGNLGRSMGSRRPVNEVVGDRILLTIGISLGTIVFTWALALPVGIYSAVRQYSIADYVLTFLGFLGMCIPGFLLALILMFWSSHYLGITVSGLFSPEFAAQPEWSWAKFKDLMKHIWAPVVVLGVGGAASLMRVMRGNLLDELRKPYVTTARARGMRPFRLLIKYPVRLALNPFISAVGALFPQLVSGGAIVAMVLSLPTVGPLMLDALMTQDMYLAGSMLMVLGLLGVLGTLVSDLLLLWLDPRIRMEEGGTR